MKKQNGFQYVRPSIKSSKISANFWNNRAVFTDLENLLVPGVYAQSGCWIVYYCCFLSNTSILMKDRTTEPIETLHPGDSVLSWDSSTQSLIPQKIQQVIVLNTNLSEELDYLVINKKIKCTPKHPFWLPDQNKWANAQDVTTEDVLLSFQNRRIPVQSIESFKEKVIKYDLLLEGDLHNYFADGALVQDMARKTSE